MKIYDITRVIQEDMMVYKNIESKKPIFENQKNFSNSHMVENRIHMDLHTGTHVDAPLHMIDGGQTIDTIPPDQWMGTCLVADLTHVVDNIGWEDVEMLGLKKGDIVLFKTKNSFHHDFDPAFVYVSASAATYLSEVQVKGVGIDALGIERAQPNHDTHKLLFESGAFILEGVQLRDVPAGRYHLIALPLKLRGLEASPVRAVLIET